MSRYDKKAQGLIGMAVLMRKSRNVYGETAECG